MLPAILLSAVTAAALAHGDHDHDAAPATPPPPKVGVPAADKKAEPAADPAALKEENTKDAGKPVDNKP